MGNFNLCNTLGTGITWLDNCNAVERSKSSVTGFSEKEIRIRAFDLNSCFIVYGFSGWCLSNIIFCLPIGFA